MDFFAGSGTTIAVAEKLNRKWIACDVGKLAFYTMQKRILNIEHSRNLEEHEKRYGINHRSFITVNTGIYDLNKLFRLNKDHYTEFVMNLFQVEKINKKIGGIRIDGERKDGYYCIIYPYWDFKNAEVNQEYLEDLHLYLGNKINERIYIIAPANYVNFITDYQEIGSIKYYFLKVPYQVIKELHKVHFKKIRQPQSKNKVNDLEDVIGFHFIRQPYVKSEVILNDNKIQILIKDFLSDYAEEETNKDMGNFESLAMVLIDNNYNDEIFIMDNYYFANDLLPKAKKDEDEETIKQELKQQKEIMIELDRDKCGRKVMVIYIDIYGNEFKEALLVGE
jgi:adenine-specific DNA-methyltransferase